MAACDVTQFQTNIAQYTAQNLGGVKNQKAMLAMFLQALSGVAVTDKNTSIAAAATLLRAVPPQHILAGQLSTVGAAYVRNGGANANVSTFRTSTAEPYFETLSEQELDKLIAYLWCKVISVLIP